MGDLHGDPVLSLLRCLFFFGAAYTGILFFLRCAVCFLNLPLGGLYGDFRSFSAPPLVLFWVGSPFFLRFQCGAVLYFRCMARGARFWLCFFVVFGRLVRRFGFAVSWLCECRLNHLGGGVNKKKHTARREARKGGTGRGARAGCWRASVGWAVRM